MGRQTKQKMPSSQEPDPNTQASLGLVPRCLEMFLCCGQRLPHLRNIPNFFP